MLVAGGTQWSDYRNVVYAIVHNRHNISPKKNILKKHSKRFGKPGNPPYLCIRNQKDKHIEKRISPIVVKIDNNKKN